MLTLADTLGQLGKAARDGAGWRECLDKLAYTLDGVDVPWDEADRWQRDSSPVTSTASGPTPRPSGHRRDIRPPAKGSLLTIRT